MFTEDTSSRGFPAPRPIPVSRLARQITLAGSSTTLPMRQGSRLVTMEAIADSRHAARLFFMFDTSTQDTWNTAPPMLRQDLEEALEDLRTTRDAAMEEGYPQPAELALTNAERILRQMYSLLPIRLEVYPTPDEEVAVVAPGAPRHSVMVLCESSGGALCMVNMDGKHRRARYSTADSLPDGFLRDALNELGTL